MSHTKEPWFIRYCDDDYYQCMTVITNDPKWNGVGNIGMFNDEHDTVAIVFHQLSPEVGKDLDAADENARRIVACVNACAGISTDNIENNKPFKWLTEQYNSTTKERDKLAAINVELVETLSGILISVNFGQIIPATGEKPRFENLMNVARKTLAKAKESETKRTPVSDSSEKLKQGGEL